jgi:hypothetical protein
MWQNIYIDHKQSFTAIASTSAGYLREARERR